MLFRAAVYCNRVSNSIDTDARNSVYVYGDHGQRCCRGNEAFLHQGVRDPLTLTEAEPFDEGERDTPIAATPQGGRGRGGGS